MKKKNSYQMVIVHTAKSFQYEFLTDFIYGHSEAVNQLYKKRDAILAEGHQPSIIWRDMFFDGTDVYRLMKADTNLPVRIGIYQ